MGCRIRRLRESPDDGRLISLTALAPVASATPTRRFLPEVQALRALAVVLVVIYHLQPGAVPGGFIGVDVFFVVSGYLITGHLLREHARTGRISFAGFWAARARRILPAALVCIVVTVVAVHLVYPPTQWAQVGFQGMAAALSVLNWVLAADSVDYSAATNEATPFQHFWSLGVEEQFYLLWPVVVLLACVWAIRIGRRRLVLSAVFGVVVAASFLLSVVQATAGDPAAYFTTTTRVWELAAGGLLAVWVPHRMPPPAVRTPLSLGGVAVILFGAFVISGDSRFPGALALIPVLGTAAVIVAGATSGRLAPSHVYERRPVQWLGDVSYSLYLWHFPPIVLFVVAVGGRPGFVATIAIAAGALAAASLSHRFIEQPARTGAWSTARPTRALALGAASVAVVCLIAATLPLAERRVETEWIAAAAALEHDGFAGAASAPSAAAETARGMTPAPSRAGEDEPHGLAAGCTGVPRSPTTPTCVGGDPDGDIRVALVGDSHAKQWATAVFRIAEERGWRVETYAHASCPFNVEQRAVEVDGGVVCRAPNLVTMEKLLDDPYDIVITANWASGDFVEGGSGHAPGVAGYAEVWNRLADAGSQVVVIKDVPKPRTHPLAADCLGVHYDDPASCAMPRDEALAGRDIVDRAQRLAPRALIVDITDRLCDAAVCPAVIGNVVVYRDTNHLTDTFVRTLTPFIDERLPRGLGAS